MIKIAHTGDIHIGRDKDRVSEFKQVFNTFLKSLNEFDPDVVVFAGDIFHYSVATSETLYLLKELIDGILSLEIKIVIISGNHDLDFPGAAGMLEPIIATMYAGNDSVHYLSEPITYDLFGVNWTVFTSDNTNPTFTPTAGQPSVALIHDNIRGAKYNSGMKERGGISISQLDCFDVVMLGHIHKHQFITPTIAYCGSLIQQNIGETHNGHGYVKWYISQAEVIGEFQEITNFWGGMIRILIDENGNDITDKPLLTSPYYWEIKTPDRAIADDYTKLFGRPPRACYGSTMGGGDIPTTDHGTIIQKLIPNDIYLKDIIVEHERTRQKCQPAARRKFGKVSLGMMKFFGLYAFGAEQKEIDFVRLGGKLSGLIGPNFCGKSSVVMILIFALYDSCPVMSKKCMVHIGSKQGGMVDLTFEVDGKHGQITKTISKSGTAKYAFVFDGAPVCPGGSLALIKAEIEKVVGSFNDNSSIQLQGHEGAGFINAKPAERKTILEQFYERDEDFKAMLRHASDELIKSNARHRTMLEIIGSRDDLEAQKLRANELNISLVSCREKMTTLLEKIEESATICDKCGSKLPADRELILTLENVRAEIVRDEVALTDTQERIAKLTQDIQKMDEVAHRCEFLKTYKQLLGPGGISAIILQEVEANFVEKTNAFLQVLGAKFNIITKGGFDLRLGNEVPLAGASGYQKFVLGLAVRLTLWQAQPQVDIFIIDEGFGACDDKNIDQVAEAITCLAESDETPSVVFVISHVETIKQKISMLGLAF